ncbi:erythromycin esterase family protein [Stutzerimonas nitrititolerans]|uniref:erythromycin esterase family protein n=1 Tax=Stutzerimonas nitrititolerans TaxID=2482751 RepID=UPI0028992BC5|nr:erythromycin esterase family protein [Stutzerimonas nitrititolerans]
MAASARERLQQFARQQAVAPREDITAALREAAEPLPDIDSEAFGALFDRFGNARVVLIGEASHGTHEFYRARAAITRRLIEQHGFTIVAAEADWPDAGQIDRYVRDLGPSAWRERAFARFPTWMWRNAEVAEFAGWLHGYNQTLAKTRRVEFRGLDVYSLCHSIGEVLGYLERTDPQLAQEARERYACFSPWQGEPAMYGHLVERDGKTPCEDVVADQLEQLLGQRLARFAEDDEAFFDATQNARVIRSAEQYYRAMYRGRADSWNLRDRHMFDTLRALLTHRGKDARAVVWAHNSHIGDARATGMGWGGRFNLGELCRIAFGKAAVLLGMGTDRGQVAAADHWDGEMHIKDVLPSRADSWEGQFLRAGIPASLTDWRGAERQALRELLAEPLLARAIGVIYRPQTERQSHYSQAVLSEQYDAYLWFEQTRAVTPLPGRPATGGEDDTFPFGV